MEEITRPCRSCRSRTLALDPESGKTICNSCGVVNGFDDFQHHVGGVTGPTGTFIRLGTCGTGTVKNFKEIKISHAQKFIDDFMFKLGLSGSKTYDVKFLIEKVTDGEYGQGDWFPVFVGACAYVVMRKDHKMLPVAEVADLAGCDEHILGHMITRLVKFMDLKLPEFDIVNCYERSLKKCPSFSKVPEDVIERMLKQGVFLLQCLIKWYVTTGRRPMPVVGAVLVLVGQLCEVNVKIEDIARELNAALTTCRKRYKEILERLMEVGQVLPWGNDLNLKNIVRNAPFVIQYMEMKSMNKEGSFEVFQCDMEQLVGDCLKKEIGYGFDNPSVVEDCYFEAGPMVTLGNDSVDKFQISPECLAVIYSNYLDEVSLVKAKEENGVENNRKGCKDFDFQLCSDWWKGESDMSKKLRLKQILEKDVGLDVMPPSFNRGILDKKRRREKINAAKARIHKIRHPGSVDDDGISQLETEKQNPEMKKGKRKRVNVDIGWEDLIIETLLLHEVKEEEIEKGYYNVLLDLHVFVDDHGSEEEITSG